MYNSILWWVKRCQKGFVGTVGPFGRFLKVNRYQMAPQRVPNTQFLPNNSFSGAWHD